MDKKPTTIYDIKINPPIGRSGDYAIEQFHVTEKEARYANLRAFRTGRKIDAGTYYRLIRGYHVGSFDTTIVMSDVPAERGDLHGIFYASHGSVLINGLGLGLVVEALCQKPEVTDVTVIEISQDVINLVASHYLQKYGDKLTIIHADALTWKPPKGKRYDVVWNDIWDNICADNLSDMHKLHRKYGGKSDWIGSWCRNECERAKNR